MGAGGKGYGPENAPGMSRGPRSVNTGMNPAPKPKMNKSQKARHAQPDRKKAMDLKEKQFRTGENQRGMGSI